MNSPSSENANEVKSQPQLTEANADATEASYLPSRLNPLTRRVYVRELLRKMPPGVQNRITVLKNLQVDYHYLQVDYYREIFNLEKKYHQFYKQLYDQREKIITGEVEPSAEQPKWSALGEESERTVDLAEFEELFREVENIPANVKGVPYFWFHIFRNSDTLSQIIYEHDVPALKALRDLKIRYNDENSFMLEFQFDENPYFTNQKLTKEYFLKNIVDKDYPFGFEGLEIYKCQGCAINWKDTMNLTMKTLRKRERHRETGIMRTTIKEIARDSFFNFFNPPQVEADKLDGVDEETLALLQVDFEIGHFMREEIIPKAVLYFTGDIIDDEEDDDSSGGTDDEGNAAYVEENEAHVNKIAAMLNETITHN